jgi:hypothetical protein
MSKRTDLATTVNITSSYAGEFAGKYISAALLSASTIEAGGVEIMPNVKYKQVIQRVETGSDLIAAGSCDFTANSSVTLTEVIMQPEEFQVNLQLCTQDFLATWESSQMGFSAFNDGLPSSFSDYLIGHVMAKIAAATESNIWQGNLGGAIAGEFNGLVTLATADAAVLDVAAAAAGGLTAANVIDEMQKAVDTIPNSLYGKEDLKLYISPEQARLYVRALGGFSAGIGANGTDNRGTQWFNNDSLSFSGVPVFVARGMPSGYMIIAETSNLFFGTGLLNDYNEIRTIDMSPVDGSQNVRMIARFTAAVQIGVPSDVVLYTPA